MAKFNTNGYKFLGVVDAGRVITSCDNCSSGIRYIARFEHIETGVIKNIGQTCLVHSADFPIRKEFNEVVKKAKAESLKARNQDEWLNYEVTHSMIAYLKKNPYIEGTFGAHGSLHQIFRFFERGDKFYEFHLQTIPLLIAKTEDEKQALKVGA